MFTDTITNSETSTLTGGDPLGVNFTETNRLGWGYTAAALVAHDIGAYPTGLAAHDGATPQNLEMSDGVLFGVCGHDAHPLQFAGREIAPTPTGVNGVVRGLRDRGQQGVQHGWHLGYTFLVGVTSLMAAVFPGADRCLVPFLA